jgi:hypothetical protein
MRFPYSGSGKPLLPVTLMLGAQRVSTEGLLDARAEFSILPKGAGGN